MKMSGLLDLTHCDFKPKQENYFGSLNHSTCYCLDFCSATSFTEKEEGGVIVCQFSSLFYCLYLFH